MRRSRSFRGGWPAALALVALPAAVSGQNLADHTYSSADIEAGARVYVGECALCHGANGDGVDGIDLRTGRFRTARSDEDVRRVVSTGVGGSRMPAFDHITVISGNSMVTFGLRD